MTYSIDTKSKRNLSTRLATGIAISALLALGMFATSASAADHGRGHGGGGHRGGGGGGHRGGHGGGYGGGYNGGYYGGPPVVYGPDYGYPPPVVYGPGIGINLPGVSIGVR
jgi:hypothetical protein